MYANKPWLFRVALLIPALVFPLVVITLTLRRPSIYWGKFRDSFLDGLCYLEMAYANARQLPLLNAHLAAFADRNELAVSASVQEVLNEIAPQCTSLQGRVVLPWLASGLVPITEVVSLLIVSIASMIACSWILSFWFWQKRLDLAAVMVPVLLLSSTTFRNWGFSQYPQAVMCLWVLLFVLIALRQSHQKFVLWCSSLAALIWLGTFTYQSWPIWLALSLLIVLWEILDQRFLRGGVAALVLISSCVLAWSSNVYFFGNQNGPEVFRSMNQMPTERGSLGGFILGELDRTASLASQIQDLVLGLVVALNRMANEVLNVFATDAVALAAVAFSLAGLFLAQTRKVASYAVCLFLVVLVVSSLNGTLPEYRWGMPFVPVGVLATALVFSTIQSRLNLVAERVRAT